MCDGAAPAAAWSPGSMACPAADRLAAGPARWRHLAPCLRPFLSCTAQCERLTWAGLITNQRPWASAGACGSASVDRLRGAFYLARSQAAPSSNGKTTDSDSVNRGSNPRGASIKTSLRHWSTWIRFRSTRDHSHICYHIQHFACLKTVRKRHGSQRSAPRRS